MLFVKKSTAFCLAMLFTALVFMNFSLSSSAFVPDYQVPGVYASYQYYTSLIGVTLTGDMRTDMVSIAKSQVGYMEGDSDSAISGTVQGDANGTVFHHYFGYKNTIGGWCGMFVSWCAEMAGVPKSIFRRSASAQPGSSGFRFFGSSKLDGADFEGYYDLVIKGGSYLPQAGDLIFFSSSNSKTNPEGCSYKHVGMVEKTEMIYENGELVRMDIYTIEGNLSDKVREKTYKISASSSGWVYDGAYIGGFGIPAYQQQTVTNNTFFDIGEFGGTNLSLYKESTGEEVRMAQLALSIYSLFDPSVPSPTVNGVFDEETDTALRAYQTAREIDVDGSLGKTSWGSLRADLVRLTGKTSGDYLVKDGSILLYKGKGGTVTLPDGYTKIAPYAFYGCADITTLVLPFSYKTVSASAFYGSGNIETVRYLGNKENYADIFIGSGNKAFTAAKLEYASYLVTFKTAAETVSEYYTANTLPLPPMTVSSYDDEAFIYYFLGWNPAITPVVKDTVYQAQYIAISKQPVRFLLNSPRIAENNRLLYNLAVFLGSDSSSVSSFSICLDYSAYTDQVTFDPASAPSYLEITDRDGVLYIKSTEYIELYESQVLATLAFTYTSADDTVSFSPTLSLGEEGYLYFGDPASKFSVPSEFSVSNAWIPREGGLTITDVTDLLDLLASADSTVYTITDVSILLDMLSTQATSSE